MKALVLKQIKQPLAFEERSALVPANGQVVVRLEAASLNRRDYWITQGMYPGINPPVVLGSDGAGIVSQTGPDVDTALGGQQVIIDPGSDWGESQTAQAKAFQILGVPRDGTFATEVLVNASQVHVKPPHLSWHEAAALPLAGVTAFRAVFTQGMLRPGETVLITGIGGGVATFALQYAVAAGAKVWVTSSSEDKISRGVEFGADGGLNYRDDQWSERFGSSADAPNLIIDSAGGPGYSALLKIAAPGGRIVNYGATAGPPEKLDLFKIFWKQLRLQGSTMGSPNDFAEMLAFVNRHEIRPIVDAVFPLDDGNRALGEMKSSPQFGKFVLETT